MSASVYPSRCGGGRKGTQPSTWNGSNHCRSGQHISLGDRKQFQVKVHVIFYVLHCHSVPWKKFAVQTWNANDEVARGKGGVEAVGGRDGGGDRELGTVRSHNAGDEHV